MISHPPIVFDLEAEFDVAIRFRSFSPNVGDAWEIWIDDEPIDRIGNRRDGDGFTVYAIDSERFRELVRMAVREGHFS